MGEFFARDPNCIREKKLSTFWRMKIRVSKGWVGWVERISKSLWGREILPRFGDIPRFIHFPAGWEGDGHVGHTSRSESSWHKQIVELPKQKQLVGCFGYVCSRKQQRPLIGDRALFSSSCCLLIGDCALFCSASFSCGDSMRDSKWIRMDVKMSRSHDNFGFFRWTSTWSFLKHWVPMSVETKTPEFMDHGKLRASNQNCTNSNWMARYWMCCGETVQQFQLILQRSEEFRPNKWNCCFCITRNQVGLWTNDCLSLK